MCGLNFRLTGNDGTTNLLGRDLGHVQNDNGRDKTDTETSNQATSDHDVEASGGSLKDTTDGEDGATKNNGKTTTDEISEITGDDGTEESTSGQDGGDERLLRRGNAEGIFAVCDDLGVEMVNAGELDVRVFSASVLLDEEVHVEDTSHPAGIITEEDTTEGCESNNQVGTDGDRSLNAVDIGRAGHGDDSTSRHVCDYEIAQAW